MGATGYRKMQQRGPVGKRLRFEPSKNGQKTHVKGVVDKEEKVKVRWHRGIQEAKKENVRAK